MQAYVELFKQCNSCLSCYSLVRKTKTNQSVRMKEGNNDVKRRIRIPKTSKQIKAIHNFVSSQIHQLNSLGFPQDELPYLMKMPIGESRAIAKESGVK